MQYNITYIQGSESDDVYLVHLCVTFFVRSLSHVQWCEGDRQGRDDILEGNIECESTKRWGRQWEIASEAAVCFIIIYVPIYTCSGARGGEEHNEHAWNEGAEV